MTDPLTDPAAASGAVPTTDPGAAERWVAAEALFQEALAHAPDARDAFLRSACPDASLRAEVAALLAAHEHPGVLDALAAEVMTPLLGAEPHDGGRDDRSGGDARATAVPAAHARFRVSHRLGGGGMGVVYRAHDTRLGRDVALKFLPPHLSADPGAKRRFLVEARAAAALEHPNVCTVHEIGESADGQLYIVMACYEGETLDRRIARGPLPVPEALRVAGEIARGLARAHERGIVHRDVKPANVMLTSDGLVKVLDFGIAKLQGPSAAQTIGAVGTLAYMSPEQAFGEAVDHRTDLWSLGVVLYEMLAGVRPFRGAGEQAVLVAALTADPEPLARLCPDAPPGIDAVVRRLLAKSPAERYTDAAAFVEALGTLGTPPAAASGAGARVAPGASALDGPLARGGERRHVAVLAATFDGQAALLERLAPDEAGRLAARLHDAVRQVAQRFDGVADQLSAESAVLLFGLAAAHEDDAVRAVRAALALQERVADIAALVDERGGTSLRLRAGVHVGAVVAQPRPDGAPGARVTGAAAGAAARLAAAADAGQLLVSAEAHRLVAPFVYTEDARPLALRPDAELARTYRVLGASDVRSRLELAARGRLTPFAGRSRERAALADLLAAACAGSGRTAVLVGEAGAGKSRLLHELRDGAAEARARVALGRCDAHGGGTPFLPFLEATQDLLRLPRAGATAAERHDALVAAVRAVDASLERYLPLYLALLAIPSAAHPVPEQLRAELFQAAMLEGIAALFTLAARETPTVLLLEDWHWADEASRAALRQLSELVPGFPLLLVVTSRPDANAAWGTGEQETLLHLGPLDETATEAIARVLFDADRVAPELVRWLHDRTGGNPFFLEEVCAALSEDGGVVVREGEAGTAGEAGAPHVPETVQGVLRTRIDRLDPEARDVLRLAAVIGREFSRGTLEEAALAAGWSSGVASAASSDGPSPARTGGSARPLERLKASGLVQQVRVVPEPLYRFKHALTLDVAYDSLLEYQRAALHAAVGRAIERRHAPQVDEYVDRLAQHFGRAGEWVVAVRYAVRSAERAMALSQNAEALASLERAEEWLARVPHDAEQRDLHADVLLHQERLCEAMGLRTRQLALVERLIALLAPHGPSARLAEAYLRQGDVFTLLRRFEAAERALSTARELAAEHGDAGGERSALRSLAFLRGYEGRHEEARAIIEHVIELGRAASDTRAEAGDLATLANTHRALGDPQRALAVLQAALERTTARDNPIRYSALLNVIGTVHRELGDHEAALHYFRRIAADGLEERHPINTTFTLQAIAYIHLQQGEFEAAIATYRRAVELNRKARYADGLAHTCRSLGEMLAGLGRMADAVPYLHEAAQLFAQLEDPGNELRMWRRLATAQDAIDAPDEARRAWGRVAELAQATGDPAAEADAAEGLARSARRTHGALPAIVAHYETALALALRLGDRRRELAVRNALGIVHWEHGAWADAVRHYEAALRLCRETDDRVHEGLILNSLGASLNRLHRWDEARTVLAAGVRAAEDTGERRLQAHALGALGDACLASGRLEEARASFAASLALRPSLGDRRGEGWMLERLARAHLALGRPAEAAAGAAAAARVAHELADPALGAALAALPVFSAADAERPDAAPLHLQP